MPVGEAAFLPTKILNALIHSALASGCHEHQAVDRGLAAIFALDQLFEEETTLDAQGRTEVRFFCHQLLVTGLEGEVAVARAYEVYRRLRLRIAEIGKAIPSLQGGKPRATKTGKPRRKRRAAGERAGEEAPAVGDPERPTRRHTPGDDFHLP